MDFKEWLEREELLNWYLSESGFFQKMKYTLPFLALPLMQGNIPTTPEQPRIQQIDQFAELINAIQNTWHVTINPNQIKMIRPIDVIKPAYGNQWNNVYGKAKTAQGPVKYADIDTEIPAINTAAVINTEQLNKPIPVIIADPSSFGQKETKGFCANVHVGGKIQKFCVVSNINDLSNIRHELRHSTQDTLTRSSLGNQNAKDIFNKYFMDEAEIGVRLAEMKTNYYQLTGKVVQNNNDSFKEMLLHFLKNNQQYSKDVQSMKPLFDIARKKGLLSKVIIYLQDNIDKVVSNQQLKNIA